MSFWRNQAMFKWLTLIGINLVGTFDLVPWLSFNPFKALVKRNMHAYCTIKMLMTNSNGKVNMLQIRIDLLTISFK